jgi:hypothetical protein
MPPFRAVDSGPGYEPEVILKLIERLTLYIGLVYVI